MRQDAKTRLVTEIQAEVTGADGFTVDFKMDDSFAGWLSIVRWNLHYHYWRPLLISNIPDLFRKVIWRKLWRLSA